LGDIDTFGNNNGHVSDALEADILAILLLLILLKAKKKI